MLLRNADRLFKGLRARPDVPWWQDVLKGAVLGDFAGKLGVAGATTQIALSFVPAIGDLCIMRDLVADMRAGDSVDIALNVVALTPFLGGVAKTADVLRNTRRVGQTLQVLRPSGARGDGDGFGRAS
jgi:hypothetical protein